MKLFLEKGILCNELANALAHFEKKTATLGMHPDELVGEFHHSNMVTLAEERKQTMRIFNSRKKYLEEREYTDKPSLLSIIR